MKKETLLVALLLLAGSAAGASWFDSTETAAVIQLSGTIQPSSQGFTSSGITPGEVRDLTSRALQKNPEAVIYEINSGGGAVVASKEVMRSIETVEKPTVCRLRDVGASGAYLAALGCDRIVADSASLTGSIGVRASYLEFSGLLRRFGVEYINLTAGRYKDAGSRYQNITEEERRLLQQKIEQVHDQFVSTVAERRNLTEEETERVKTGQAFLGTTARDIGLVDRLGGRKTALRVAEELSGEDLEVSEIQSGQRFSILSLLTSSLGFDMSVDAPLTSSYR